MARKADIKNLIKEAERKDQRVIEIEKMLEAAKNDSVGAWDKVSVRRNELEQESNKGLAAIVREVFWNDITPEALRMKCGELLLINEVNPGYFMSPITARNWLNHFTDKNHLPRIHPHQFRHTAISLLLQNGISKPEAAKRAGHSRPDVTLRTYSHTLKDNDCHCCEVVTKAIPKMPKRKTG